MSSYPAPGPHGMISSRTIERTPVWSSEGAYIGEIHSLLLDKRSGKAERVLVATTWFLGGIAAVVQLGWDQLTYSLDRHGYIAVLTRAELETLEHMALDASNRPVPLAALSGNDRTFNVGTIPVSL